MDNRLIPIGGPGFVHLLGKVIHYCFPACVLPLCVIARFRHAETLPLGSLRLAPVEFHRRRALFSATQASTHGVELILSNVPLVSVQLVLDAVLRRSIFLGKTPDDLELLPFFKARNSAARGDAERTYKLAAGDEHRLPNRIFMRGHRRQLIGGVG
jgi:hypothetical protein